MEYNNKHVYYKVDGNFTNMMTGGGDELSIGINNNEKNSIKKVRRSFSITRNPFRWSRKYKTNNINDNECINNKKNDENLKSNDNNHYQKQHHSNRSVTKSREGTDNTSSNNIIQQQHQKQISNNKTSSTTNTTITNNQNNNNNNKILRKSSFRKFLSRIAQHVTSVSIGVNKNSSSSSTTSTNLSDRVPPIGGYQWPPDQTPGVTGLKNHGNTCFMNAVLQCLSHTDILAEYFVLDQYKADLKRRNKLNSRKFGTKGELTEQLANVLKALWTCKNESDHSTSFKAVVDRYGSQFQNSTQHDAQEFLLWLLDKVHEDLNTATKRRYKTFKNNYGRPDEVIAAETLANHIRCNNSFVQAVFQAQFRSSLTCPRCHKQSNTFDPFHCISVQLPQLSQQIIFVTVLYLIQHPRQVKLGLTVPSGSPIIVLREQLNADTGIPSNRMVLVDINENGFSRVFYDSQPISTLDGINSIYCVEIPEIKDETSSSELMLLIANVKKHENGTVCRFGTPFSVQVNRDCSYVELQKKLLKEMSAVLKPEIFAYTTPLTDMFDIRLQDPSADPDTYLEQVEHPLLTEIIDMALSVLSSDAGPPHIKLLLEWENPENFFLDLSDPIVEHESVSRLKDSSAKNAPLTLEQCLEHYTKAETLSAEDAWRCPNCQQYLPVVKTLGLWSLPDILVIHFKRFRQQNGKGPDAAKLTTMVKFPLNAFDMSPHLARGSTASNDSLNKEDCGGGSGGSGTGNSTMSIGRHLSGSPWRKPREYNKYKEKEKEPKDNRYDLYAVCYHQGETLETGHYTAACKNPYDHQWYKFDDQRVTHVPADQVQDEIVNNEAYILFYQRRKIDNSECSGTSSTSGDHWVSRIPVPPPSLIPTNTTNIIGMNNVTSQVTATASSSAVTVDSSNENCDKSLDGKDDDIVKKIIVINNRLQQQQQQITEAIFIEKTDENEVVDVEGLEENKNNENNDNDDDKMKSTHCTEGNDVTNSVFSTPDQLNGKILENNDYSIANSTSFFEKNTKLQKQQVTPVLIRSKEKKERNNELVSDTKKNLEEIWPNNKINHENNEINTENKIVKATTATTTITEKLTQRTDEMNGYNENDTSSNNLRKVNNKENNVIATESITTVEKISTVTSSLIKNNASLNIQKRKDNNAEDNIDDNDNDELKKGTTSATTEFHSSNMKLRHSFSSTSSSSNYKLRDTCDTLSMLRNTNNSCSKDTLIYIDQQNHHHNLIEEDDTFLGSRSIWISPVTPHKLITVSPKN